MAEEKSAAGQRLGGRYQSDSSAQAAAARPSCGSRETGSGVVSKAAAESKRTMFASLGNCTNVSIATNPSAARRGGS